MTAWCSLPRVAACSILHPSEPAILSLQPAACGIWHVACFIDLLATLGAYSILFLLSTPVIAQQACHLDRSVLSSCMTETCRDLSLLCPDVCRKMSAAADDRKSSVEGTPMGGGPVKGAAEITGGYLNYTFIVLNLILSWFGFFLVLCSLSALQNQINKHQDIQTSVNNFYVSQSGPDDFHAYAVNAGYPALPPGRLLRFEW